MDKERGFEEVLAPPVGISEAEEDKLIENSKGDNKQLSKPRPTSIFVPKKKAITVFKKKEKAA